MSQTCEHFDEVGLAQWIDGAPADAHTETCGVCQAQRQAFSKVAAQLGQPRGTAVPPAGWEARVFEAIDARRGPRRSPRWRKAVAGVAAVAAVLVLPLWLRGTPSAPTRLSLAVEVVPDSNSTLRGQSARAGDSLALHASINAARHAELRVWRDDGALLLRCPPAPGCEQDGAVLKGTVRLPTPGRYRSLVVSSDKPLPEPLPRFSEDAAQLISLGANVEVAEPLDVY